MRTPIRASIGGLRLGVAALVLGTGGVADAGVQSGGRVSPQPIIYQVEGYLDHAPAGTCVREQVTIGFAARMREFALTAYQRFGDRGDPWLLTNNLGAYHPDFLLIGTDADIARILDGAPETHVTGRFQYLPGIHSLLIDPHALVIEAPP
jgi:hypothetical protein